MATIAAERRHAGMPAESRRYGDAGRPAVNVIEVSVPCDAWLVACPEAEPLAAEAVRAAVATAAPPAGRPVIVGVVLTDDAEQRQLNLTWRGKDSPTNVLAFATGDADTVPPGAPLLLGDIVLAFGTVAREAAEQHKPLADHLRHLVVHGALHLLGLDHQNDTDAAAMEARETEILARLGVPDPYRDTM